MNLLLMMSLTHEKWIFFFLISGVANSQSVEKMNNSCHSQGVIIIIISGSGKLSDNILILLILVCELHSLNMEFWFLLLNNSGTNSAKKVLWNILSA